MANFKNFFKTKNKKVSLPIKILSIILVILIAAFIYFTVSDNSNKPEPSASPAVDDVKSQETAAEDEETPETDAEDEETSETDAESNNDSKDIEDSDKTDSSSTGSSSNSSGSSGSSGSTSGASGTSGSSSGSQSNHKHVWKTRTETVQEPQTTIVTEEKQYYTLYRFYWYNTNKWEESRDRDRFTEWQKSENGQLYPLKHPYAKPEDNPLFKGYDSNGNPTYTNDHSIISNLFDWVPCEPYEKTEMVTVKRTVTYCSICGATK